MDLDRLVADAHASYVARHAASAELHGRASRVMPGGNTRSVLHFDPFPFRVASASGAEIIDVDGHTYVDFLGNYTAGLFGHSPKVIADSVIEALSSGFALGATHPTEIELAELLCSRFEALERVRFTNSGTEANLMAIGTALHHTRRTGVGVFEGAYHGGVLSFGHGAAHPLNVPHRFVLVPFDEMGGLGRLFADDDLGCVIVEAVQGAGGCIPASEEFISELSQRCTDTGTVLILDEVMTSRLGPGGAQRLYGIRPDMMSLGKYLGGGMTFGAFGGRADIMAHFDPAAAGVLTQAGTFNNNIVTMTAAKAAVSQLLDDERLAEVNGRGDTLRRSLDAVLRNADLRMWVTGRGSMLTVHAEDDRLLDLYFHAMLADGHYLARRGFIALSFEIDDSHCDRLVSATEHWVARVGA
ncbi:MAG: aminotransferase class III-fold pyridoxal phosphate-dependent enzyme [Acidimicrobiia bacterium]|nr:aminotransferase class III-fold pyridoxal phosphate-dependent enzyme [Acidimicrobiia bacterium]